MLKYRPDIDGLRCIAVLAVVIYHARFDLLGSFWLSGGYLGVDIFFVISGYLITLIILKEKQAGQFSFAHFYYRRCRRILPALFLVITASLPLAWFFLMPSALKEYAGSILSALFFGSNIWFFQEDIYTAGVSQLKPFLHTWSLSVEEQFYLVFPLAVLLIWKCSWWTKLFISFAVFFASLLLAHGSSQNHFNFSFYLLPTRIWELLAGAILAGWVFYGRTVCLGTLALNVLTSIAFLLLIVPLFIFSNQTHHPSLWTVLPVLGAVMSIYLCQQKNWLTTLLSIRPMVWVGKWSYSLYLWHFPIFAFARVEAISLTTWHKWALIFMSCVFSIVSYYYVEQRMRKQSCVSNKPFFTLLIIWFIGLLSVCIYFYASHGAPNRLGEIKHIFTSAEPKPLKQDGVKCHQRLADTGCKFIQHESQRLLINVGDSHADSMAYELKSYAESQGLGYLQMTENSCPLVKNSYGFRDNQLIPNCHPAGQSPRLNRIKRMPKGIVIYSGRFPLYLSAQRFDNGEGGVEDDPVSWIADSRQGKLNPNKTANLVQATIQEMLDNDNYVVIIYPVPEVGWDVPLRMKKYLHRYPAKQRRSAFTKTDISTDYTLYKERSASAFAMYDGIADHPNLIRIYPDQLFCNEKTTRCDTHDEIRLYYSDDDHVSHYGSQMIVNNIAKKIKERQWLK